MASKNPAVLGPWGGSGGAAFDDGYSTGGIKRVTLYYMDDYLRGLEVVYGKGTTVMHGARVGTSVALQPGAVIFCWLHE
ncbi:hypothetical protein GOP47_0015580 [Adiantum capillus-veneris]|uniref:Jacalin-type lectin domain-containing protein n=1 Tax=Adiantum capillus-veneris TaxID=13818 RepID=A0A9D4ZBS7_ADICA|nr:hypothetical protein GOP47_0015580 [Adiantum capillus-veneris]